jgi:hypothetical protein
MIVEGLLCVLASYFFGQILNVMSKRRTLSFCLSALLICLVVLDLNPTSRRYIQHDVANWSSINRELSDFEKPVVVELPPQLNRGYFPIHYVDAPQARTLNNRDWFSNFLMHASFGEKEFVSYLGSREITHVIVSKSDYELGTLAYKWGSTSTVELDLTDSRFIRIAESSGEVPAVLLQLRAITDDSHCVKCRPYEIEWNSVRQDFYTMGSVDFNQINQIDPNFSWAYPTDNVAFRVAATDGRSAEYQTTVSFIPAFGENAPPQVLSVEVGSKRYAVRLRAGEKNELSIVVHSREQISIRPVLPCAVVNKIEPGNPDPRSLCFGISAIKVREL